MEIHVIGGRGFDSNIYLVVGEDRGVIIDCGTGRFNAENIGALKKHLSDREVDAIVLTHMHYDHSGGAGAMAREFQAPIKVHEEDARALMEGNGVKTGAILFGGKIEPMEVESIEQGQHIAVDGDLLEVIHTPGHTPGSISLFNRATATLFSGDLIFADGGVGRWDLPGGDFTLLKASVMAVSKLGVRRLYPGHGPVVEGEAAGHINLSLRALKDYERFGI